MKLTIDQKFRSYRSCSKGEGEKYCFNKW